MKKGGWAGKERTAEARLEKQEGRQWGWGQVFKICYMAVSSFCGFPEKFLCSEVFRLLRRGLGTPRGQGLSQGPCGCWGCTLAL